METTTPQHPKFVRWALMLGIVIILNIFFNVLVNLALPAPEYNHYCPNYAGPEVTTSLACEAQGGVWNGGTGSIQAQPAKPTAPVGYCDLYAKCQPLYQAASDKHALYAFTFMVGLGVLALIAGIVPIGSSIVSSGLSYGGVAALVVGSIQYWGNAGQWIRFAIALAGLLVLLYIGWKRFKD